MFHVACLVVVLEGGYFTGCNFFTKSDLTEALGQPRHIIGGSGEIVSLFQLNA